ncbi:Alpha-N-acetylgalactosaminide alpha-2,6-sialyltransferase 5 [Liparis tanakae]|uniref:Alpha-N-acetylgalactosaminide alpha-2,6-sialyltransferase 5 n=1 Tax=Liparis tanakae TaxID=230148 RepID=A0A4Z2JE76_9TELE|nr:Alpha-N-acetylgalactosaminide alpha-2,6-sialyltransferase 5 [Liparis tanakae]
MTPHFSFVVLSTSALHRSHKTVASDNTRPPDGAVPKAYRPAVPPQIDTGRTLDVINEHVLQGFNFPGILDKPLHQKLAASVRPLRVNLTGRVEEEEEEEEEEVEVYVLSGRKWEKLFTLSAQVKYLLCGPFRSASGVDCETQQRVDSVPQQRSLPSSALSNDRSNAHAGQAAPPSTPQPSACVSSSAQEKPLSSERGAWTESGNGGGGSRLGQREEAHKAMQNNFNITELPPRMHCQTCALVTSSGHLVGGGRGEDIDRAECVIRMNDAPTARGYAADVGRRTALRVVAHSSMQRVLRNRHELLNASQDTVFIFWGPGSYMRRDGKGLVYNNLRLMNQVLPKLKVYIISWQKMLQFDELFKKETGKDRPPLLWMLQYLCGKSGEAAEVVERTGDPVKPSLILCLLIHVNATGGAPRRSVLKLFLLGVLLSDAESSAAGVRTFVLVRLLARAGRIVPRCPETTPK